MKFDKRFLVTILITLFLQTNLASDIDPHTCVKMTEENSPIISQNLYKELVGSLTWDIEQDELISNLSEEHNYIMLCALYQGFNFANFERCSGEKFSKVIDVYTVEFIKLKFGMVDGIVSMLKAEDYDAPETKPHLNNFRKELLDDLNNNINPKITLNKFEDLVKEAEHYNHENFLNMYKKLQNNYYIYVALKKIIKGYAITTIRCLQDYFEMSGAEIPEGESIRLYNKSRLDDSFPDEEINSVFSTHQEEQKEFENMAKNSSGSFNSHLAKQKRYEHLLSMYVANGKITESQIDKQKTPQYNFKKLVTLHDIPKSKDHSLV